MSGVCFRRAATAGLLLLLVTAGGALADVLREAERACRNTTMSRLRLGADAVQVLRGPVGPVADERQFSLQWFAADRSQGTCRFRDGRLQWSLDRKGQTTDVETACKTEVARRVRKRPRDIDIVGVEPRGRGSAVRWTTYQGHTGTCWATAADRIDRVEED